MIVQIAPTTTICTIESLGATSSLRCFLLSDICCISLLVCSTLLAFQQNFFKPPCKERANRCSLLIVSCFSLKLFFHWLVGACLLTRGNMISASSAPLYSIIIIILHTYYLSSTYTWLQRRLLPHNKMLQYCTRIAPEFTATLLRPNKYLFRAFYFMIT